MKTMATISFVVSAVLIAMACVRASRVRAWRESINPSAPEVPDSAFVLARILFLCMAAVGLYSGFHLLSVADDAAWSDAELTSAVKAATQSLDGSTEFGDVYDDGTKPADFQEYATKIEDEIAENGGGDAPGYGVDASLTGSNTRDKATYRITATGAAKTFCMRVTRTHTDDYAPAAPGLPGDEATVTMPIYTYAVSSREGEC
jgi:hypothetical protein